MARLQRELLDPRTYGRIGYLLIAGVLGTIEFAILVTAISLGVGLAVTLIGIPILIASVYAWGWMAEVERRTIAGLTGTTIPNPYRPVPASGSFWARLRARLADPATWKDLTFLLLQFPFGLLSFIVAAVVICVGIQALSGPLWYWASCASTSCPKRSRWSRSEPSCSPWASRRWERSGASTPATRWSCSARTSTRR
jgi:hypothetical protein